MEKKRMFGELELAILQLFKTGRKLTVRDVLESLKSDDKYTTIMTVMNRMVEKNLLLRERIGQHYEYCVNESERTVPPTFLDKLKEKIFGGKSLSMVSYLLENASDITENDLEAMEKIIKNLKRTKKAP